MNDSPSARRIVAQLDRATKVRMLSGADHWSTEAVEGLGIPSVCMADGPTGLRRQVGKADHAGFAEAYPATCFPTAVTLGSSWDLDLIEEVGRALGKEAQALNVDVLLSPGLNIKRHPAGGRNFEYYSEDPLLSGRGAIAMVNGIQSQGVGASVKHFAVNNQEHHRMRVDAVVDERTLREIYLAGFEMVVKEADPWTVMSCYNRVNGQYGGESQWLISQVLRDEWGFRGLVVSDWHAVFDRVAGVQAGLDLEMPGSVGAYDPELQNALDNGSLDEADVDACCARLIELAQRCSTRPRVSDIGDQGARAELLEANHQLARRAAAAGTVLLRNDGILPLQKTTGIGVIGSFADNPRYQGNGSSKVNPARMDTLLSALKERAEGEVAYASAYEAELGRTSASELAEAVRVARQSDVVIVVVGLTEVYESEGYDRTDLEMPESFVELVETITAVNDRTIVVLQNGAPIEMPWVDQPAAIIEAWLGGQAGGSAIVDVLTGDVEPGGRLAESFPVAASDLPSHVEFANHPTQVVHRETQYVGYRFHDTFDVDPLFPFGHGLGYTTWDYGSATVTGTDTDLTVSVPITNTGDRAGSEVVQLYIADVESTLHRPGQELKGFAKVELKSQQTGEAVIALDRRSFAVWDVVDQSWKVEAGVYEIRIGSSSRDIRSTLDVDVVSDDVINPAITPSAVATDSEMESLLGYPVPEPDLLFPYTRNTMVGDLNQTVMGRSLRKLLELLQPYVVPVPDDEAGKRMLEIGMREAPLRMVANALENSRSIAVLDLLIKALNGAGVRRRRSA